jgi:nucleotide-binding universal stress UspA family protein
MVTATPIASGDSRPLTPGEIALAKRIFGDSLNYDDVRIQNGKDSPLWKASAYLGEKCGAQNICCRAQTFGSTIFMPQDQYHDDYSRGDDSDRSLFVHEITHAWQFQNMQVVAGVRTVVDAVNLGSYDAVYGYKLDPKKDLGDYNVEQQACIMEAYHEYLERGGKPPAPRVATVEDLNNSALHRFDLMMLGMRRASNPDDPRVKEMLAEGLVSFDAEGKAHYTQAFADKHNANNANYVASRLQADKDLLKVMANFRRDPSYLDSTTEVTACVVVAALTLPVVAPAVLVGTAAYKVNECATVAMDTYKIWAHTDAMVAEMTAPGKFKSTDVPALSNYKQCLFSNARFSHHMRTHCMKGDVKKNSCGRITNLEDIDFSIAENRAEFSRMLDIELQRQRKIRDDNSSVWPRWARSGDSVSKEASAKADIMMLESAKRELASFDREVASYKRDQAAFDEAFKLHRNAARDLATKLNGKLDAATVRTATQQFLMDEQRVREKASALPESAQRQQLLRECDINSASANYSLASAAETPQQAVAAMQKARDYMQKAGLDPAKEESYKAFGTTKEEFERRAEAYKKQAAEPAKPANAPDQKGYLSAHFSGGGSTPAGLELAAQNAQQRRMTVAAAR